MNHSAAVAAARKRLKPPLVSKGQASRPVQPHEPLQPHELAACDDIVRRSRWWARAQQSAATSGGVLTLLATYVTDIVARPWVLGSSAALHGVPLVVIGHGLRWEGVGQKMVGARRAAQMLDAIAPRSAVVFADGSDTAVVNPVVMTTAPADAAATASGTSTAGGIRTAAAAATSVVGGGAAAPLRRIASADAPPLLLFSGECSSWPVCYRDAYRAANHTAWGACTCVPGAVRLESTPSPHASAEPPQCHQHHHQTILRPPSIIPASSSKQSSSRAHAPCIANTRGT